MLSTLQLVSYLTVQCVFSYRCISYNKAPSFSSSVCVFLLNYFLNGEGQIRVDTSFLICTNTRIYLDLNDLDMGFFTTYYLLCPVSFYSRCLAPVPNLSTVKQHEDVDQLITQEPFRFFLRKWMIRQDEAIVEISCLAVSQECLSNLRTRPVSHPVLWLMSIWWSP